MKTVNILYANPKRDGNELAFIFPVIYHKNKLEKEYNLNINFYDSHEENRIFECDTLVISSWYFGRKRKSWLNNPDEIISFILSAKKKNIRVVWSDISDSTGTTQFSVLPHVDKYIKCQLLKDRTKYLKTYYGGRIFTDFYHTNFNIQDETPEEKHLNIIPVPSDLYKLEVSWNTGLATYSEYGPYYNFINYRYFNLLLPLYFPFSWSNPDDSDRTIDVSCRIGTGYKRNTISYQRIEVKKLLHKICDTSKIKRTEYFRELKKSKINVSPFGLGEITLRDFEIFVAGALIFKPNCDHMETWPNFFIAKQTYVDFKWDLSDFHDVLQDTLHNKKLIIDISKNGQRTYYNAIKTKIGHFEFCERFNKIVTNFNQ
jgi:hypothetical protein